MARAPRAKFKFTDKDKGWKEIVHRAVEMGLANWRVDVGVVGPKALEQHGSITNAEVGLIMELGSPSRHIPARSWLRSSFDRNRDHYYEMLQKAVVKALDGKAPMQQLLGLIGLRAETDVRRGITSGSGIAPENAASTIKRKGSSRPLVDTSQFLISIASIARRKTERL